MSGHSSARYSSGLAPIASANKKTIPRRSVRAALMKRSACSSVNTSMGFFFFGGLRVGRAGFA